MYVCVPATVSSYGSAGAGGFILIHICLCSAEPVVDSQVRVGPQHYSYTSTVDIPLQCTVRVNNIIILRVLLPLPRLPSFCYRCTLSQLVAERLVGASRTTTLRSSALRPALPPCLTLLASVLVSYLCRSLIYLFLAYMSTQVPCSIQDWPQKMLRDAWKRFTALTPTITCNLISIGRNSTACLHYGRGAVIVINRAVCASIHLPSLQYLGFASLRDAEFGCRRHFRYGHPFCHSTQANP